MPAVPQRFCTAATALLASVRPLNSVVRRQMKWLSDLLKGREYKPASLALRPGEKVESPLHAIDWKAFEAALLQLFRDDLAKFIQEHSDETFYAIGLDCNALYGDILLCANTPEALRERAVEYAADTSARALARQEATLRWGFGDWKYQGFNIPSREDYERYRRLLPDLEEIAHPFDQECLLKAAARALVRLERSPEAELLKRTPDFDINCVDHDEEPSAGKRRISGARKAVA
jgi:hypothetical protein